MAMTTCCSPVISCSCAPSLASSSSRGTAAARFPLRSSSFLLVAPTVSRACTSSSPSAAAAAASSSGLPKICSRAPTRHSASHSKLHHSRINSFQRQWQQLQQRRPDVTTRSSSSGGGTDGEEGEVVYFDGGVHYGDLVTNLVFGLTLVWLPLTVAAVFRALFLRYRFTDRRVTIKSGLLGGDRKDFPYDVVRDVKVVPRFIGEWGDMALELKDGTKVDFRCVPKFREVAKYIEERAAAARRPGKSSPSVLSPSSASKKGFS